MIPTITVFAESPDRGRGLARDMAVRWALEEVGQPYRVQTVTFAEMKEPPHLARQPFGQIPSYEEGSLTLFESGAIVLHLAERHPGLLPADLDARARAKAWMFAAASTIEPPIVEREGMMLLERERTWYADRLALLDDRVRRRLEDLSARLGGREWLDGEFSAGDLLMVQVLRRPAAADLLSGFPDLGDYVARGEARPAFHRAFAGQRAVFEAARKHG